MGIVGIGILIYYVHLLISNTSEKRNKFFSIKGYKIYYDFNLFKDKFFYFFVFKILCFYIIGLIIVLVVLPTFISLLGVGNCSGAIGSGISCSGPLAEWLKGGRAIAELSILLIMVTFWIWIPALIFINTKYTKKYNLTMKQVIISFLIGIIPVTSGILIAVLIYNIYSANKDQ